MLFHSVIDPSIPTTTTVFFPSDRQLALLHKAECELEDLEHDIQAHVARVEGVELVECVSDDDNHLIAVRVSHRGGEPRHVKKSVNRSIDMTISILQQLSPILGGYA